MDINKQIDRLRKLKTFNYKIKFNDKSSLLDAKNTLETVRGIGNELKLSNSHGLRA